MFGLENRTKFSLNLRCSHIRHSGRLVRTIVRLYSNAPKSGRPDFGAFRSCPVLKRPDFERSFDNRTILSGFRTFGQLYRQTGSKPVLNRFGTGSEPYCRYNCPNVRNPDVISGFQTTPIARMSENRTLYPVFRRLRYSKRPITGHLCPDFRRLRYSKRPITGYNCMNRTSDSRTCQNPDIFSSGLPNRTSGYRTFTVHMLKML